MSEVSAADRAGSRVPEPEVCLDVKVLSADGELLRRIPSADAEILLQRRMAQWIGRGNGACLRLTVDAPFHGARNDSGTVHGRSAQARKPAHYTPGKPRHQGREYANAKGYEHRWEGTSGSFENHPWQPSEVSPATPVVAFRAGNETQVAHFYTHPHKATGHEISKKP
jgi:hypothetical protein